MSTKQQKTVYYIVAQCITPKLCVAQVVQKGINMNKEKEATKPTSFRITPETSDQIKDLCKQLDVHKMKLSNILFLRLKCRMLLL